MGDLSGGQSLKKVIRSALALSGAEGTSFYEFDQIATPEAKRTFKEHYRQALDELSVDAATIDRIVAEANTAFLFNRDMVHELEADVKEAIGEHTFDLLQGQQYRSKLILVMSIASIFYFSVNWVSTELVLGFRILILKYRRRLIGYSRKQCCLM